MGQLSLFDNVELGLKPGGCLACEKKRGLGEL